MAQLGQLFQTLVVGHRLRNDHRVAVFILVWCHNRKLDYPAYLFFPKEGGGFYGSSVRLSVYGPEGITKVHFLNPRKTGIKGFEKEATRVASFSKSR